MAWIIGVEVKVRETKKKKQSKAIHDLLADLIYDWLGALNGRRGHVKGRWVKCRLCAAGL